MSIKLFPVLVLILFGCISSRNIIENSPDPVKKKQSTEISTGIQLKAHEFPKEIARLEAMISRDADLYSQRKTHLRLAMLYLDNKNPAPNYSHALKELELYVSLDSEGGRRLEIHNLLRALQEIVRLTDENKKIRLKMELAIKENEEIKKTVEELRNLDLRIEERRRQIK